MSNGMSPEEIRKAFAEKAEMKIRDEKRRQDFLALIERPEVKKAAVEAARALSTLDKLGLQIADYCAIGRKVSEVELESTMSYEKAWIKIGGQPAAPIED